MITLPLVHSPLSPALSQIFLFLLFPCLGFLKVPTWQIKYRFLLVLFLLTCVLSDAHLILSGQWSPSYSCPPPAVSLFSLHVLWILSSFPSLSQSHVQYVTCSICDTAFFYYEVLNCLGFCLWDLMISLFKILELTLFFFLSVILFTPTPLPWIILMGIYWWFDATDRMRKLVKSFFPLGDPSVPQYCLPRKIFS